MKTIGVVVRFAALALLFRCSLGAQAQANPTAIQTLQLSAFAGGTGVLTGLAQGKTLNVTAGADLGLRPFFSVRPSIEVRGTYPVDTRGVDNQRNVLGGLKVEKRFGIFHPYLDFLAGRGQITYTNPYPDPAAQYYYLLTSSTVLSPGIGVDVDLTPHFAVKVDVQYQRYDTPVTLSGKLDARAASGALIYRFNFNRGNLPKR